MNGKNARMSLTIIVFVCVLGLDLVRLVSLPINGALLGISLLLGAFIFNKSVPKKIDPRAGRLLVILALFVVPTAVGVLLHGCALRADMTAILTALGLSTLAAIAVTGCRYRPN